MSVRASGNPGSARRATRVALVLGLLTALAGPMAPLTAAAGGVTVTTPFPAIVAEPGSTASFKLAIDVSSARQVSLKAENVPSGWTARFLRGRWVVGMTLEPGDGDGHPLVERQRNEETVELRFAFGAVTLPSRDP